MFSIIPSPTQPIKRKIPQKSINYLNIFLGQGKNILNHIPPSFDILDQTSPLTIIIPIQVYLQYHEK